MASVLRALASLLPPPPAGAPGPFALSEDGALEQLVRGAGLTPRESAEVECPFVYADDRTARRALLSSGPCARVIQVAGLERTVEVVDEAIAPFRSASAGYRLENVFRYLVATA
jgi:hypothetical protein